MGGVTVPASPAVDEQILLARAYLSRVAEPANVPLWDHVSRYGPVAVVDAIKAGTAHPDVLAATQARREQADPHADLAAAERHGIRLVTPESSDWPHFALSALECTGRDRAAALRGAAHTPKESGEPVPPIALWVQGNGELASLAVRSVGIVGARAATAYGEHVTAELSYGLSTRSVVVVSGGAYGIDAAAHRAALTAAGLTVIVSAAGLDRPYPSAHAPLYARAAESGLVISESPPGAAPHRHRFLTRNRLIAAFSTGTVIVEAARRSGAANTASHCFVQGRPVMAVPGPVTSPMSAGCHELLRREQGPALLVTCVDDVLAVVGSIGEASCVADAGSNGSYGSNHGRNLRDELELLDATARRVFEGIPARTPATPDAIAVRSGVGALEVIRALPVLQLADLIEASDSGYRLSARLRSRRA
jgi:DNA processing protein